MILYWYCVFCSNLLSFHFFFNFLIFLSLFQWDLPDSQNCSNVDESIDANGLICETVNTTSTFVDSMFCFFFLKKKFENSQIKTFFNFKKKVKEKFQIVKDLLDYQFLGLHLLKYAPEKQNFF